MAQKKDLRIVKTDINIRNTFIQLLNEKDFHSITVQDLLDRALINRSTFYKHYSDKFELAEAIAKDFLDEFESFARIKFSNHEDFDLLIKKFEIIIEKFYEQRLLILGLWKIRTEKVNVYEDMKTILKQQYIMYYVSRVKGNCNINFHACIFASVALTTLSFMMENKEIYTAHELIEELQKYYSIISIDLPKVVSSDEKMIRRLDD